MSNVDKNEICAIKDGIEPQGKQYPLHMLRKGKCKWFNVKKGWGFIEQDKGGMDVFCHQSVIQMRGFRSLAENELVEFTCIKSERGLEATMVRGQNGSLTGSTYGPNRPMHKKYRKIRCYNCDTFTDHIAKNCLEPQLKKCHYCKSYDHIQAECPKPDIDKPTDNVESLTQYKERIQ